MQRAGHKGSCSCVVNHSASIVPGGNGSRVRKQRQEWELLQLNRLESLRTQDLFSKSDVL